MAFVMVMHEQQLKNINANFLTVQCQISKCSAACTIVSEKLALFHKEYVKDNDDALPK
jgi:hypothetical protein